MKGFRMSEVKIIELKQSIFENNDKRAALLRDELKAKWDLPPKRYVVPWFRENYNAC